MAMGGWHILQRQRTYYGATTSNFLVDLPRRIHQQSMIKKNYFNYFINISKLISLRCGTWCGKRWLSSSVCLSAVNTGYERAHILRENAQNKLT